MANETLSFSERDKKERRTKTEQFLKKEHLDTVLIRVLATIDQHPNAKWVKVYNREIKWVRFIYFYINKKWADRWAWGLWLYILRHAMDIWMRDNQDQKGAENAGTTNTA